MFLFLLYAQLLTYVVAVEVFTHNTFTQGCFGLHSQLVEHLFCYRHGSGIDTGSGVGSGVGSGGSGVGSGVGSTAAGFGTSRVSALRLGFLSRSSGTNGTSVRAVVTPSGSV